MRLSSKKKDNGPRTTDNGPTTGKKSPWSVVRGPWSSQSGIALLLVIGAIVVLTMLAVEFAYNSQVEYHLAVRQKERLQAYYLAQSGYNLTLLELKIGSSVQSQVASATAQAKIELPIDLSVPLCQQFPMKTSLMRMVLGGEEDNGQRTTDNGPTTGEGKGEEEGKETKKSEMPEGLAGLPLSGLEEFLKFDGDFDAECSDESAKIDLNFFYSQDPAQKSADGQDNPTDAYKKFLINFFSQPKFQELFLEKNVRIPEVVRNIADWVDPNETINEIGGGQGGGEDGPYQGVESGSVAVKNGKFSTPFEIYRVAGVQDEWWHAVQDYFTIYGMADERGNPQINVCRAPEEVVRGLLLRYLDTRKDLPPLPPDNGEMMKALVSTVKQGCTGARPDKNKMAQGLDAKLNELLKINPAGVAPPPPGTQGGGYAPTSNAFADWVSTGSRFFSLNLIGQVRETVVKIHAVVDLGEPGGSDSQKWKIIYWKVE